MNRSSNTAIRRLRGLRVLAEGVEHAVLLMGQMPAYVLKSQAPAERLPKSTSLAIGWGVSPLALPLQPVDAPHVQVPFPLGF